MAVSGDLPKVTKPIPNLFIILSTADISYNPCPFYPCD